MRIALLALAVIVATGSVAHGGKVCDRRMPREQTLQPGCKAPMPSRTLVAAAATGFRLGTIGVPATPILH